MKTLGMLGGVGPQTTAKIYLSIVDSIRKSGSKLYPPIVIYNLPFPFVIEDEVIVQGINSHKMIPYLVDGAKVLENSGADFGILPCNTLHKYIGEIRDAVKFPFLSMIGESASYLKQMNAQKVGILATKTTIDSDLYRTALNQHGIDVSYPTEGEQLDIDNIIIELLNGSESAAHCKRIEDVCKSLYKTGVDYILLACTDLQLAISKVNSPVPLVDTTEIIILASIREMAVT